MKTIKHTTTLFYYDGPQVFEARDRIGGHYIAVMVEPQDGKETYLVAGVLPESLRQFRGGRLDLRTLLAGDGSEEWYLAHGENLDEPLALMPQTTPLGESGFLPDAGFLLHDRPAEELALRDLFAGQALTGLIMSQWGKNSYVEFAKKSYAAADAMLFERSNYLKEAKRRRDRQKEFDDQV